MGEVEVHHHVIILSSADLTQIFLCFSIFLFFREWGFFRRSQKRWQGSEGTLCAMLSLDIIGRVMGSY